LSLRTGFVAARRAARADVPLPLLAVPQEPWRPVRDVRRRAGARLAASRFGARRLLAVVARVLALLLPRLRVGGARGSRVRPPLDPAGAVRGSCLCGAVTFVVEGKPLRAVNCHCGRCRRARSAAHAANLFTAADGVKFTRGESNRSSYKLPEARFFTQVFCR